MNNLELFVDDIDGYLFAATVDNGYLIDLYVNKPYINGSWASIYLGKVIKVDTKQDAAFIDLGNNLVGYLPADQALARTPGVEIPRSGISKMVKNGDTFLVQVKAEGKENSIYENHKHPRLTANLHVPGGFLIYMPHSDKIQCSGNIDEKFIDKFKTKINTEGGWKFYPSAVKLSKEEIEDEIEYLKQHWQHLLEKAERQNGQPGLIEVGPIALFRAFMDYGAASFDHIYAGNSMILKIISDWSNKHLIKLATSKRLRLFKPEKTGEKLFDAHDLYGEIEKLKTPLVEMTQGGNLIIETTSAFTTIDVNQGSSSSIEDTNFRAAYEVSRQIRLRNLSGTILIDFIGNVPLKTERKRLIDALESYFKNDIGDAQVHGFTRLGIVEITRRRRSSPLHEKINF